MATLNFPDAPDTGDIYTDSNSGFTYEWNGTVWISSDPSTASNIREIDDISGDFDGSDTTFTLKVAAVNVEPANVQQLIISVGGVMQNAGQDYTVDGSTITFTTAPTSGLTFFGTLLGTALSLNTVADGSVSPGSLTTTSNYMMGGLTVDQSAGIITAYQFKGDGSGLTGVASTDNIKTSTDAYFGANVSIGGSLTVQGTETIINVEELNVQDKTIGIGSTSTPTATTQDGAGAIIYGQTHIDILYDVDKAALGISTGVNVAGFVSAASLEISGANAVIKLTESDADPVFGFLGNAGSLRVQDLTNTANLFIFEQNRNRSIKNLDAEGGLDVTGADLTATQAVLGTGVTINNTGIDAGIGAGIITAKEYYGDATNMTGAGSTFQVLTTDPYKNKEIAFANFDNTKLVIGFNHGIAQGNADKEVTLRETSATGTIVQSFGVGSSVTYNAGQAIVEPSSGVLTNEKTFFLVIPAGSFKKIGTATSNTVFNDYSFTTVSFTRNIFATGQSTYGIMGNNIGAPNQRQSSPIQIGSNSSYTFASPKKNNGINAFWMKRESADNYSLWMVGAMSSSGQSGLNIGGSNVNRSSPTQVGTNTNWANVSQGNGHTLASKTDGTIWTWGYGDDGALGINVGNTRRSSPTQVGTDTTWTTYHVAGENWNAAIKTDGTLWSWGAGQSGRPLGFNQSSVLGFSSPKQVGTDTTWAKMHTSSTNGMNMYCIKTDNTMWVWGQNYKGLLGLNQSDNLQLSSPTQLPGTNWHEVSSGGYQQSVLATKSDGTLWAWGNNDIGQLGANMTTTALSSPTQVGSGTDWSQGRADRVFSTGGDMSVAAKTVGTLGFWGNNDAGQGGHTLTTPGRSSPIQVGTRSDWSGGQAMGQSNDATMYFFSKQTN